MKSNYEEMHNIAAQKTARAKEIVENAEAEETSKRQQYELRITTLEAKEEQRRAIAESSEEQRRAVAESVETFAKTKYMGTLELAEQAEAARRAKAESKIEALRVKFRNIERHGNTWGGHG